MEMRGIEPLSENPSAGTSTVIVSLLNFPHTIAERQAMVLGSFIGSFYHSKLCDKSAPQVGTES